MQKARISESCNSMEKTEIGYYWYLVSSPKFGKINA